MSNIAIHDHEKIAWAPQEGPQTLFVQCPAFEVLFGGALGGGKTDALLGDFASGMGYGSAWKGVYFRKHFPDMDDVIHRSLEIFGQVYGDKCYSHSRYQWNFPNGAILQFRALEKDVDTYKYLGQQYSWIAFDELTQWASPFPYTYLMTRLRSAKGVPVRIRAATNPGGPGHHWVKARFIDPVPPGTGLLVETKSGNKWWRVFIPSKLEDNRILTKNDPHYGDRISEAVGDPALVKALREGRWDIVAGAAFPEWDPKIHVIDPAPIPTDKPVWRAMDWGYDTPYCNLWMFHDEGDVIVAGELYGWSGVPNVGTRETPGEVRKKIENFEALNEIWVPTGMLDPQCWETRSGAGFLVDELGGRQLGWKPWAKGPRSRVSQKQGVHSFLAVVNGKSRLKVMRNCRHLIRTMPILPRAKNNIEDVDTDAEDHAYDTLRGGLSKKIPTRQQLRDSAARQRIENTGWITAEELQGGGW